MEVYDISPTPEHASTSSAIITAELTNKEEHSTLKSIRVTQVQIEEIKKHLMELIDALALHQSLFSRAAHFWGTLPQWQKITAGAVITLPLLIIGMVAQLALLIMASIFALITYVSASLLLDNHDNETTSNTTQLKASISSLASLLGAIILSLDTLREQLALELERFQKENEQLAEHINEFSAQVQDLTAQVAALKEAGQTLEELKKELEQKNTNLQNSLESQTELLQKNQAELERVTEEFKTNNNQLSEKITELEAVKTKMGLDIEQSKKVANALKAAVSTFSDAVIADSEHRASFQVRLNEFISNKEISFVQIADRICEAEEKLAQVTKELQESNERYKRLLDQQEEQIIRLEAIPTPEPSKASPPPLSQTQALMKLGLYAANATQIKEEPNRVKPPTPVTTY